MATHELPSRVLGLLPGMYPDESGIGGGTGAGEDVKTKKGKTDLTGSLLKGLQGESPGFTLGEDPTDDLGKLYQDTVELVGNNAPGNTETSDKK